MSAGHAGARSKRHLQRAGAALIDFLRGFTGMPSARLAATDARSSVNATETSALGACEDADAAKQALATRAAHRPGCC